MARDNRRVTRSGQYRHRYATRLNRGPAVVGLRLHGAQQRLLGWDFAISRAGFENEPAQMVNFPGGGRIEYGPIVDGRRSYVRAHLEPAMLRAGSRAAYSFPFFRVRFHIIVIRGHLLARVLGGSGADPRNLVPLPHLASNLPSYADIESRIQKHLESRQSANFAVHVEYGDSTRGYHAILPTALIYRATDALSGARILQRQEVRVPIRF